MSHGMIGSPIATDVDNRCYNCGCNNSAQFGDFSVSGVEGMTTPSVHSSASQVKANGVVPMDTPQTMLESLLSCNVGVECAANIVLEYYKAANRDVSVVDVGKSEVSVSSAGSQRYKRWEDKMRVLPDRYGYCYLSVVRWSHRPHLEKRLGFCPSMSEFVSVLRPNDLDYAAARRVKVYRLNERACGNDIRYHLAEEYPDGRCIGTFDQVLSTLLNSYPWLTDYDFALDVEPLEMLPLVGHVGIDSLVTQNGSSSEDSIIRSAIKSSEVQLAYESVKDKEHDYSCQPMKSLGVDTESANLILEGCHVRSLPGFDGFAYHESRLSVDVTLVVQSHNSDDHVEITRPDEGADLWIFPNGSIRSGGSGWEQFGMEPVSSCQPCVVMKHSNLGDRGVTVIANRDLRSVKLHFDTDQDIASDLWVFVAQSGMMHVLLTEMVYSAKDYYYSCSRTKRLYRPVGTSAVLTLIRKAFNVDLSHESYFDS